MANLIVICGCSIITMIVLRKLMELRWKKCIRMSHLSGKTIVITGATSGLGLATAEEVSKKGATVIMACRNLEKCNIAIEKILAKGQATRAQLLPMIVDLCSMSSVRRFSKMLEEYDKNIDFLLLNAGVYKPPEEKNGKTIIERTDEGFELHMAVNHLSHFLITNLVWSRLVTDKTRIVVVSSLLYKHARLDVSDMNYVEGIPPLPPSRSHRNILYNNSKYANVLFTKQLAEKTKGTGVECCCLCPGLVYTDLGRYAVEKLSIWKKIAFLPVMLLFMKTPKQGIQTILHCIQEDSIENGALYRNCEIEKYLADTQHEQMILWKRSEELVGL